MFTQSYVFEKALSVWEKANCMQMNQTLDFVTVIQNPTKGMKLCVAGSSSYEVFVNHNFVAHGPARCAHGFYKVDELFLEAFENYDSVEILIRVTGYNVNSYCYLDVPSFLCAEIKMGERVVAYTHPDCVAGFRAYPFVDKIRKTPRYSFQRTFTECYRFEHETNCELRRNVGDAVVLSQTEEKHFLHRDVPYGEYNLLTPKNVFQRGQIACSEKETYLSLRSVESVCDNFKGFYPNDFEYAPHVEYQKIDVSDHTSCEETADIITLESDHYTDLDMAKDYSGIVEFDLESEGAGILFLAFDEVMEAGALDCFRGESLNVLSYQIQKGSYHTISLEPYVFRYARLIAVGCSVTVKNFRMIQISYPQKQITSRFCGTDSEMNEIYDAAVETFCANAVDIFMDCPMRERAGWLCDSYFTGRSEYVLTGKNVIERAFLYNFLYPQSFQCLPKGMLPMCYPADHYNGQFIPNWAMWFGVELLDYYKRTHDRELINDAKEKMYSLIEYFRPFENEFGLLENLKAWVFVDWSKAKELTQDVSFCSNMMYVSFLSAISDLYEDRALSEKAEQLAEVIRSMSVTESGFYCDNAIRRDGKLIPTGECTEACQYYAFFCEIATPEIDAKLWNILVKDFGYDRLKKGLYPQIYPCNAFIGNYLRLDLLDRYGQKKALYDNIKGYFSYMAEKTGTLWEKVSDTASCNHGFASYAVYWMKNLGLLTVEPKDSHGMSSDSGFSIA